MARRPSHGLRWRPRARRPSRGAWRLPEPWPQGGHGDGPEVQPRAFGSRVACRAAPLQLRGRVTVAGAKPAGPLVEDGRQSGHRVRVVQLATHECFAVYNSRSIFDFAAYAMNLSLIHI